MAMSNQALLRKAAGTVTTDSVGTAGANLLSPEQSSAFLDKVYDVTAFSKEQRNERRKAATGSISKLGIAGRILRKKTENVDDATLIKPAFSDVDYAAKRYRADTEITEEVFEDNIEGEAFEDHWINTVADQIGRDLEDLHFNGNESLTSDPFIKLNDGWLIQSATGGSGTHRVNAATIDGGAVTKGTFFAALAAMPGKYKSTGRLRFLGNPTVFATYLEYLTDRATGAGDAALTAGSVKLPNGTGFIEIPSMPTDRLLLVDPKNLIVVTRREIRYRKTTEGREAIRQDKRFYAWFMETDPIIEEADALVDVYGVDVAA